jgi:ABC-type multidrug transport system ATPase subunit
MLLKLILCAASAAATIEWRGITAKIKDRDILRGVGGQAKAGRLHAIMGPSGSGKTSLLSALSGTCDRRLKLSGDLRADGVAVGKVEGAYVRQQDVFYPYLTVRETLTFAATLRLGADADIRSCVDEILMKTGLAKAADTIVGDDKIRGVSGGERKRLAIACELVDDPDVLFLDEPTSGLDSFAAQRVVASLRTLCDAGKTVVCVIHQPSGGVFAAFDDLTLLSEGECMYHGPICDLDARLRKEGFPRPRTAAPAEHAVETVSVNYGSPETEASSREVLAKLSDACKKAERPLPAATPAKTKATAKGPRRRPLAELRLLYQRARRDVSRAKAATAIKAAQQVMTALIYGGIYDLDDSQRSIQDRFGLLSLCVIGATNLAIASTIRAFPKEKTIVQRERSPRSGRPMYGALPYLFSKVAAELPLSVGLSCLFGGILYPLAKLGRTTRKFRRFLGLTALNSVAASALGLLVGAVAPSTDAALAMFPPIIVLVRDPAS